MNEIYVLPGSRPKPRFPLGGIYITTAARRTLKPESVAQAVSRHSQCDWGDVCPEDWRLNDVAVPNGDRMLSVFKDHAGTRFWIITEADRNATTVLLPEEY